MMLMMILAMILMMILKMILMMILLMMLMMVGTGTEDQPCEEPYTLPPPSHPPGGMMIDYDETLILDILLSRNRL